MASSRKLFGMAALTLAASLAVATVGVDFSVLSVAETEAVASVGDAADDTAVWVSPTDPQQSVVIGTDKLRGLMVYDLQGRRLHDYPDGRFNNIDLRTDFKFGASTIALVASANRVNNRIMFYKVEPTTRGLIALPQTQFKVPFAVYGFCMAQDPQSKETMAIVTSKSGQVQLWSVREQSGRLIEKVLAESDIGGVTEGCVADDEHGVLYVSEEKKGIWKFNLASRHLVEPALIAREGILLRADVEGLAIYKKPDGTGYLVASSQGDSTYVVYARTGRNEFIKRFNIVGGNNLDGVSGTDGIEIISANLGPQFPMGILVAQDGMNMHDLIPMTQNFKLVSWASVQEHLP